MTALVSRVAVGIGAVNCSHDAAALWISSCCPALHAAHPLSTRENSDNPNTVNMQSTHTRTHRHTHTQIKMTSIPWRKLTFAIKKCVFQLSNRPVNPQKQREISVQNGRHILGEAWPVTLFLDTGNEWKGTSDVLLKTRQLPGGVWGLCY